jgi:tRNA pseudouridine55 synthase
VDKPAGITSHDVIYRLRKVFGVRKIGHAGTLDPMATGLLIAAFGPATKLLQFLNGLDKKYEGEITLGATSTTCDAQGELTPMDPLPDWPPEEKIADAMRGFEGEIEQAPPVYSSIKVKGRRLYEYAHEGLEAPKVEPRKVRVDSFRLADYSPPTLRFQSAVSSGTYIRSLARDLGERLGCGGYLSALRRTEVGKFGIEDAATIQQLQSGPGAAFKRLLRPAESLPHLPMIQISDKAAKDLLNGHSFVPGDASSLRAGWEPGGHVAVCDDNMTLLAICRFIPAENRFLPFRVFNLVPKNL